MCFTRNQLAEFLHENGGISNASYADLQDFLYREFRKKFAIDDPYIRECQRNILVKLKDRWAAARRTKARFLSKNGDWLSVRECFPGGPCSSRADAGRPALPFPEKGRRSKLKATEDLRRSHGREELVFCAASKVYEAGQRGAGKVLEEVGSPRRGPSLVARTKARASIDHRNFSADEALALVVDLDLTRAAYRSMRRAAMDHGCSLYPPCGKIRDAKVQCMPPAETIVVESHLAQVPLQDLLHHTAGRLLQLQADVLANMKKPAELTLICKWGLDGSTGHSRYKQAGVERDELVFATTLVPLELQNKRQVVWRNSTPSSPRFCRSLRIAFAKESTELTRQEIARVEHRTR